MNQMANSQYFQLNQVFTVIYHYHIIINKDLYGL